jgi:hypothetical protein
LQFLYEKQRKVEDFSKAKKAKAEGKTKVA